MKQLAGFSKQILCASLIAIACGSLLTSAWVESAWAEPEKMDVGTHRFLIEKLEAVLEGTPKGDVTRVPALLRLADLYSEEARLLRMTEIEKGCLDNPKTEGCGVSNADRQAAIKYYEMAMGESSGASQSRILFQLAYLYEANGDTKKASALYKKIISMGPRHFSRVVLGQSEAGLGEIAFKQKRFAEAKTAFERALKNDETPRRGWIEYRIAWTELNLGKAEDGKRRLIRVLKTPALLTLESTNGAKQDSSFQEDIAHDLTVFYARTGFSTQDIETLWQYSPEHARKGILIELAEEAERLGQRRAAIAVWATIASRPVDKKRLENRERIEAQIRVATLRFGLGEKAEAVRDYRGAMDLWKKSGCSPEADCGVLQKRLRKLVLDWNKNEETDLSRQLLEMYRLYAAQFPEDSEMAFWGGNVAREIKANRDAQALFHQASEAGAKAIVAGADKKDEKIRTVFEGSLLAEIEMAELTKDAKLRDQAYAHYLALNPNGPKSLEVRYQQAHLIYDRGDYSKAADKFYQIAARDEQCRSKSAPSICRQAADLALDSIVILKNDERLEATADEFSSLYPNGKSEFSTISRRARLNLAAKAANGSSTSAMGDNLKKLSNLDLNGASRTDVLLTHQNRFVLAEKTRDFAAANAAALAIINFPGATAAEREDAMAKRLWVAEMQLDFATAYSMATQMKMSDVSPAERELKLALLAELSGHDPRGHLTKFISMTKDRQAELAARVKLVKLSGYSVAEFQRQFSSLSRNNEILANVGLEVYSRSPSVRLAKQILSVRGVAKTQEGAVLTREGELEKIRTWARNLSATKLPRGAQDRVLQQALAARIRSLNDADRFANRQIQTQDGWLQALSLQTVANENRRLKSEILDLPTPKGLKSAEAKRYQTLVNQQVAPFEMKAANIEGKTSKFWSSRPAEPFAKTLEQSVGPKRTFLIREAQEMISVLALLESSRGARDAMNRLKEAVRSEPPEVRQGTIASARDEVRRRPFDVDSLKRLRGLEAEAGRETMVAYLDSRMGKLGARR